MSESTSMKSVLARPNLAAELTHARVVMRCSQIVGELAFALLGLLYASVPASTQGIIGCPAATAIPTGKPQPTASSQMFSAGCFIDQFPVTGRPIPLYDEFSLRSFIALGWPTRAGQRQVSGNTLMLGGAAGCMAFEAQKSQWEMFQKHGPDPKGWSQYAGSIPCGAPGPGFGDISLAASLEFDDIIQNRTFVRCTAGLNDEFFRHVLNCGFFRRENRVNFTPFPAGTLRVEVGWSDSTASSRHNAFTPQAPGCSILHPGDARTANVQIPAGRSYQLVMTQRFDEAQPA
jgi:hypothetical protein